MLVFLFSTQSNNQKCTVQRLLCKSKLFSHITLFTRFTFCLNVFEDSLTSADSPLKFKQFKSMHVYICLFIFFFFCLFHSILSLHFLTFHFCFSLSLSSFLKQTSKFIDCTQRLTGLILLSILLHK